MASRVPPAVTSTASPERELSNRSAAARTISSGSAMRPAPAPPPASAPETGPTSRRPSCSRRRTLRRVAGCSHISVCMAGAINTGPANAATAAHRASSAIPAAVLAITLAVAGAITTASAQAAISVWGLTEAPPYRDVTGGRPVTAARLCAPTNRREPAVITACTSAPASTRRRAR